MQAPRGLLILQHYSYGRPNVCPLWFAIRSTDGALLEVEVHNNLLTTKTGP